MDGRKIKHIIPMNKRNTKDPEKLEKQKMTKKQEKIYENRIKIENLIAQIKAYPKISNVYERTIKSYNGLLQLILSRSILRSAKNRKIKQ